MENKIIFQKLTPTDSVDMKVYEEAFEYIFANEDIKNVAIAGPYSAGKSSLLETYKKQHNDKTFLHISLAHFGKTSEQDSAKQDSTKNGPTKNDKDIETILEGKILNQLIQQVKEENIPQTNFHIKRTVNSRKCAVLSAEIIIFVLCIIHLKYFKTWSNWVNTLADSSIKILLKEFANPYSLIVSGIVAIILLGIGIYQLIITQKNKNIFRKLSVQGNEIEIFGEDDSSYFDKYLNEVLYLFEKSGVDVIVFEDLDRFDDNKIFERLREINMLSNLRLKTGKGKGNCEILRFFYLLRDDIFVNKDRTKFFDYILPVIPVLDSSNAYNQIKKHFTEGSVFDKFEEKFLRGLSLYIDDMRILKNIYNEFMIYYKKLNTIELNSNKMLAIITYKNIFPKDFSDLQLNQGFVYELFSRKGVFIEQEKYACEKRIENQKLQIDYVKKEELESINELDDIKSAKSSRIYPYNSQQRNVETKKFNEWLEKEYTLRKRAIEDKLQNRLEELEEKLTELQDEYHNLENKSLHEIITRENIDEIFRTSSKNEIGHINKFEEIKSSEYFSLLKFLIRNGYIDESYNDYMTFFYENSLSKGDKMFLRSITDKISKPYSYSLDNVPLVMSNLNKSDFEQEETMNFDLFEYILQDEEYVDILQYFVKQLKKGARYQFVIDFFETNREREKLVAVINTQWTHFFSHVLLGQKMTLQQSKDYSVVTLEYMNNSELKEVNVKESLTNYISSQQDYLAIETPNVIKLCEAMGVLNVSFKQIDFQKSNIDLFKEVYRKSLYEINVNNICLILEAEYHFSSVDDYLRHCVSSIFSQPEQPLCKYVQENMNLLLEVVLSIPVDNFTDNSADVIMVINNAEISEEYKIDYIERLETLIDTLADVNETIYQTELVSRMKVKYSAENILEYFERVGLTDHLIEFINSENAVLNYGDMNNLDLVNSFWNQCVSSEKISLKKYEEILLSISPVYLEFNVVGIPDDKMEILIKNKIIPMVEDTLVFMRENYEDVKMKYIKHDLLQYTEVAIGSIASVEEVKEILKWDVSSDIKINILSEIKEKISVVNCNYSEEVIHYILMNNLDTTDLPFLFQKYDIYAMEIQSQIETIAKKNLSIVISDIKNVSRKLLMELLKDQSIGIDNRANIFISSMGELTSNECQYCLKLLEFHEFSKIFETNRRPRIPINTMNQKVLIALKEKGFVDSFVEDKVNKVFKSIRRRSDRDEV